MNRLKNLKNFYNNYHLSKVFFLMEKIINFTGPSNFKRKDRHFKQNTYLSEQSENSGNDEEIENSSPIYKKKSHFGKEKEPEEKKINLEAAFDTDESETNTPKSFLNITK